MGITPQSFLTRWAVNSLGIWVAVALVGTGYASKPEGIAVFLFAGLIFSVINSLLRPLIVFLALPALILTLGLFMIVVNGTLVYIALAIAPFIKMTFGHSILAGLILSLLNYIVSNVFDVRLRERGGKA